MAKSMNVFLVTFLLVLIAADVSNAYFFRNFRRLVSGDVVVHAPRPAPNQTVSPIPSPVAAGTLANQTALAPGKSEGKQEMNKDKHAANVTDTTALAPPADDASITTSAPPPHDSNITKLAPPSTHDANNSTLATPPADGNKDNSKTKDEAKQRGDTKSDAPLPVIGESCHDKEKCKDMKTMTACIQSFDDASKVLVLLIENGGKSGLRVTVAAPASTAEEKAIEVPKHQNKKVNLSLKSGASSTIVLNAGNGDCILQLSPSISTGNIFQWLPSYAEMMTPMYGAYFLFAVTLIAGVVWACCKFGKRRRSGEIPYQELEMGNAESVVNVESPNGWDQGWDDDWDEENAIKSPSARHAGSISANGLTSRSANRDGWEDWDE